MSIEMFDFKGHDVRVALDEQGEPLWVASDVAKVLGYRDAEKMTRNIRERHKSTQIVDTLGGVHRMTTLTEAGLYSAILKSRVEMAEEFQDWVTDEVLPSIRKHGGYISDGATAEQMEVLQRELREKRDALDTAYSREDRTYGKWKKAQRELDSLKLVQELRTEPGGLTNVYDFIFSRTRDHAFSSKWVHQLVRDIGRDWPHIVSDRDGTYASDHDLRDAWVRYGYEAKFFVHKGEPFPSIKDVISGK